MSDEQRARTIRRDLEGKILNMGRLFPFRDVYESLDAYRDAIIAGERARLAEQVRGMAGREHDGCGQLFGDTTDADAYLYRADVLALLAGSRAAQVDARITSADDGLGETER